MMNIENSKTNAIFDLTISVRKIKKSKGDKSMILWSLLNIPYTTYVQYLFPLHQLNLFMVLLDRWKIHPLQSLTLTIIHPPIFVARSKGDPNGLPCSSSIKRSNDFSSSPFFDREYSSMNSLHEKFPNVPNVKKMDR